MPQIYPASLQAMVRFSGSEQIDPGETLEPWDSSVLLFPPVEPAPGTIGSQWGVRSIAKVAVGVYDVESDVELPDTGFGAACFDAYGRTQADTLIPSEVSVTVAAAPAAPGSLAKKRVVVTSRTGQGTPTDNFVLDLKFWRYPVGFLP